MAIRSFGFAALAVLVVIAVAIGTACGGGTSRSGIGHSTAACYIPGTSRVSVTYDNCRLGAKEEAKYVCEHTHNSAVQVTAGYRSRPYSFRFEC
jgi:hypothetical protein